MPCPGGAAHLPVVPVVDVAAVLHAVQCQVPPQGLHGMVVPLTGMGEGSRCMNQVGQCEIADPWGAEEVAAAVGTVQVSPELCTPPWRQVRMRITAPALCVCFLGWNKTTHWGNAHKMEFCFSLILVKAKFILKNVYRGTYFMFSLYPLVRDLPCPALFPAYAKSVKTNIYFN